jgi:hypothetical protein
MALSQTIATGVVDTNGGPVPATYWEWAQVNVQQLPVQTCQITLLGYASQAAYVASPGTPIATLQFSYPCQPLPLIDSSGDPLTGSALTAIEAQNAVIAQFPFSPAYLAANFSSLGIGAQQAAAQEWVLAQPPMVGATVVA